MTLTKSDPRGLTRTRSLLNHLIELPDLASVIQALPPQRFAALVRTIGVEDAGELVALATTEQLVQAFDEDLFVSERAGERETLDVGRFLVWLEVLLEAGDDVAAARVAELDEDFVAHALSRILLVLEEDALRERLDEADEDAARGVDKGLESALGEDLDGYLLLARQPDGWDATLALVLALDRDHRALLVRLLDRVARVSSRYLDDLDELSTLLSEGESLAEDAEAAREDRRARQGHVEAQAARAFLRLSRTAGGGAIERDPLTRAYFRELAPDRHEQAAPIPDALRRLPASIQRELEAVDAEPGDALARAASRATVMSAFMDALRKLGQEEPRLASERMEELAYLANVLMAGHERDGRRLRPREAADAVLATVCYGAVLELRAARPSKKRSMRLGSTEFAEVLRQRAGDLLFRTASSALAAGAVKSGLLSSAEELEAALR